MFARSRAALRWRRGLPSTARSSHRRSTPAPDHRTGSPTAARRGIESAPLSGWTASAPCSPLLPRSGLQRARPRRPRPRGGRSGREEPTAAAGSDAAASSAARTSPAVWYRWPGSFARHRWTIVRSIGDTRAGSGVGDSFRMADANSSGSWASERQRPRCHLVKNDSQRPDVRSRIGRLADEDFRRHVTRCAHHDARLSHARRKRRAPTRSFSLQRRLGVALQVSGQSEVQHLDGALRRDHDIGALQIAMHDAVLMRMADRTRDLRAIPDHRLNREPVGGMTADSGRPRTYSIAMKVRPSASPIS